MNKSAGLLLAAVLLAACSTTPPAPPPVVAVVKSKQDFPPRPLTLLYTTFQDHAVIQRDKPIPVWGLTTPGAEVEVSLGSETAHATADANGNWRTQLPAMPAGGPYTLSAKSSSGETQTVTDIMLGDVYLCSGQSNMEFPLRLAAQYDLEVNSATPGLLRLFHVQRFSAAQPRKTFGADATWSMTTPATVKEFSAVCYLFGHDVQPTAGVAVGLIEDAWGGSLIQAWISNQKLASLGGYDDVLDVVKTYAASPKEGEHKWLTMVHNWFAAHDPAMKASPPWYDPSLDDSSWNEDVAKGGWRSWPRLAKFDGVVWLRKAIEVTAAQAAGAATLSLGTIEGDDLAFVNGTPVGAGDGYDVPRVYTVPAGVLHEGRNEIVVATQYGGGFLDPADKMTVKFADGSSTALLGAWKWKTSVPMKETGRLPQQPWLNQFGVSTMYNGMILPLGATQIRGIVWYQGESDAYQPAEYKRLLPALIDNWRGIFGDVPVLIVQLPSFGPYVSQPQASDWAKLRDVQRQVADSVPDTGLAVTIDLGRPNNIHPAAKQQVGRRLALLAEKMIYGKDIVARSPDPVAASRKGRQIAVSFKNVGTGLQLLEWDRPIGFQLCDAADTCRYAHGSLVKDTVVLDAAQKAAKVRFCWADSPICNLVNSAGLPTSPFEISITGPKRTPTARHRDFKHARRHH